MGTFVTGPDPLPPAKTNLGVALGVSYALDAEDYNSVWGALGDLRTALGAIGAMTLAAVGSSPAAEGASVSGFVLTLQPADATHPGLVTALAQTFGGAKTFTAAITASNLSGTNSGDVSLGAFGSAPDAKGLTLSGQAITLQPADATHPGALTTGTQTLAGAKTFGGAATPLTVSSTDTTGTVAGLNIQNNAGTDGCPVLGFIHDTTGVGGLVGWSKVAGFGNLPGINLNANSGLHVGLRVGSTNIVDVSSSGMSVTGTGAFTGAVSGSNLSGSNAGDITLGTFGSSPTAKGASLSAQVLTLQPADGSNAGLLSTGAQTIAGAKTFSGAITASNLSGTNSGDVTLAALGAAPDAKGFTISGQAIALQPADATHPGVVTTGAQTFGGAKTFSNGVLFGDGTSLGAAPNVYGPFASRPAAGNSGRIYVANDAPVGLWVDDASAWRPLIQGVVGTQPPAAAGFTRFNNGSSNLTLVDRKGALHLSYPVDGTTTDCGGFVRSLSGAAAHCEAAFTHNFVQQSFPSSAYPAEGVCMRESATGKIFAVTMAHYNDTNHSGVVVIEVGYWSNASTRTSGNPYNMTRTNGPIFLRILRSGSNMLAQFSTDNQNWVTIQQTTTTTIFTTAPDQAGVLAGVWSTSDGVECDVVSYADGT